MTVDFKKLLTSSRMYVENFVDMLHSLLWWWECSLITVESLHTRDAQWWPLRLGLFGAIAGLPGRGGGRGRLCIISIISKTKTKTRGWRSDEREDSDSSDLNHRHSPLLCCFCFWDRVRRWGWRRVRSFPFLKRIERSCGNSFAGSVFLFVASFRSGDNSLDNDSFDNIFFTNCQLLWGGGRGLNAKRQSLFPLLQLLVPSPRVSGHAGGRLRGGQGEARHDRVNWGCQRRRGAWNVDPPTTTGILDIQHWREENKQTQEPRKQQNRGTVIYEIKAFLVLTTSLWLVLLKIK